MRLLITGARDWSPDSLALRILSSIRAVRLLNGHTGPITVVEGACHVGNGGVDGAFHRAAKALGMETERWAAMVFGDWPACGPIRNSYMVSLGADMGIACHPNLDLKGKGGTADCCRKMLKAGIPVVLHARDDDPGRLITERELQ